jgi:hypothetical protein
MECIGLESLALLAPLTCLRALKVSTIQQLRLPQLLPGLVHLEAAVGSCSSARPPDQPCPGQEEQQQGPAAHGRWQQLTAVSELGAEGFGAVAAQLLGLTSLHLVLCQGHLYPHCMAQLALGAPAFEATMQRLAQLPHLQSLALEFPGRALRCSAEQVLAMVEAAASMPRLLDLKICSWGEQTSSGGRTWLLHAGAAVLEGEARLGRGRGKGRAPELRGVAGLAGWSEPQLSQPQRRRLAAGLRRLVGVVQLYGRPPRPELLAAVERAARGAGG